MVTAAALVAALCLRLCSHTQFRGTEGTTKNHISLTLFLTKSNFETPLSHWSVEFCDFRAEPEDC